MNIPETLVGKVHNFPECSYGAQRVNLVMKNGDVVKDIILAAGKEIVKVSGRHVTNESQLGFRLEDVIDVERYIC